MDATDRVSAQIDDVTSRIVAQCDSVLVQIRAVRRYNQTTARIVMALWAIGLPSVLFASIIVAAKLQY